MSRQQEHSAPPGTASFLLGSEQWRELAAIRFSVKHADQLVLFIPPAHFYPLIHLPSHPDALFMLSDNSPTAHTLACMFSCLKGQLLRLLLLEDRNDPLIPPATGAACVLLANWP